MGATIDSLDTAFDVTRKNPAIVVVSYPVGLVGGLVALASAFIPLVGPVVGAFLLAYHVAYYDTRMGNRTEA